MGWKAIFRGKYETIFFPQNVFPHFRGGGGGGGGGEKGGGGGGKGRGGEVRIW